MSWWPFTDKRLVEVEQKQERLRRAAGENAMMHAKAQSSAIDHAIREDIATMTLRALMEEVGKTKR